jgi:hypothetical protein
VQKHLRVATLSFALTLTSRSPPFNLIPILLDLVTSIVSTSTSIQTSPSVLRRGHRSLVLALFTVFQCASFYRSRFRLTSTLCCPQTPHSLRPLSFPSPSQDEIPQSTQPTLIYTFLLSTQPPLHDRSPPQGEINKSFLTPVEIRVSDIRRRNA